MRPLDGITVLTLEHAVSAPFCTRQLADLGARVIKIERRDGGDFARNYDERVAGLASYFVWCNRSKESFALDIKHPEATSILSKLLSRTDVFVQNLTPGAASRLGLSYEALRDKYPKLIVCDISGYGSDGPYRDKKAYDLLIQSESGFLSVTGSSEEPAKASIPIADIASAMYAYSNILASLIQRAKTGTGCHIDISMLESLTEWMSYPLYYAFDGAEPPKRTGASHATIYPYGPFTAGDGNAVMLGIQNEREWATFCEKVLHRDDLASDTRFSSNSRRVTFRDELKAIITEAFLPYSAEEVIAKLNETQIANARMNEIEEVWSHAQLKARERWVEIDTPVGKVPALLPPGQSNTYNPRMDLVPAVGAHTDVILAELGYDSEAVARLRRDCAI
jgi:itaconate CoA-transferase